MYMNETNPIQVQNVDQFPTCMTMTLTNSKLNSYLKKSNLNHDDEMDNRQTAIMFNRMTQFDTLVLPSYLEHTIREERKVLAKLPPEERKAKMKKIAILQNSTW